MKIFIPLLIISFASCKPVKPVQYLEYDLDTSGLTALRIADPIIQRSDFIGIVVHSDNPAASGLYQTAFDVSVPSTGYLVDAQGYIAIPNIGQFKVEGMTKKELSDSLVKYFIDKNLLQNPLVEVRFLNFKITVLGEVSRPNQYNYPGEKLTVLEAIGLAGDLTPYAKRNITVVREVSGQRTFGRLDLDSANIFNSPYYNLMQGDVILVDKTDRKKREPDTQRRRETIAIGASIISVGAILISVLSR